MPAEHEVSNHSVGDHCSNFDHFAFHKQHTYASCELSEALAQVSSGYLGPSWFIALAIQTKKF